MRYSNGNRVLIVTIFLLSFQTALFATIAGSPHDFSGDTLRDTHGIGEICKVCHTPHNAGSNLVPLWRGRLSSATTYALYSSDTLDATVNQPLVPTKACLTCHDGAIAKGPVTGCESCHYSSTRHPEYPAKNADLAKNHPVSFRFDTALAQQDGALQDPSVATVSSLGGKTIKEGMLYQDRLECSSCHDVHSAKGDSKTAPKLLLVSNDQSSLCLTCHVK